MNHINEHLLQSMYSTCPYARTFQTVTPLVN